MAEVIGEAILSAVFQSLFSRIDSGEIVDFFRGGKQVVLLEKLKTILLSVEVVLVDAEMKQLRNLSLKRWVEGLKDAAEDAENLLDGISTDALEVKILSAESGTICSPSCVNGFFSAIFDPRYHIRKVKMEEILGRLENFASQKDILGLKIAVGERVSQRLPLTSLVENSEVYGRKEDKDALKKLVLSDGTKAVSVIPIVGMGGVGKTTLAQAIFNDGEVNDGFEVKVWVCVSEEFDVCKVTKTVVEVVTNLSCDTVDFNTLQVRLKERLKEKKFLIVLDDVWNENYDDWDVLRRPFQDGAKGSKMIVTTRIEKVALVMGSSSTHYLKGLSDEDCWELFVKHASGNGGFVKDARLEVVGREIVKKCKGLPLAAKTLGGLLRSTVDLEEWERVLVNEIWDFTVDESNILPALQVSYHYLPSHLKRCFAHCSMFPKDYEFQKEELVLLWMAENLLDHSTRNKRMEEVGDDYFNDLVSRSFFQRMSDNYRSWFVMHDLIVDLAKFVSGNSFQLEALDNSSESVMKVRHLTYFMSSIDSYKRFNHVFEASRLRTILPLVRYLGGNISDRVVHDFLFKFKCLRSLSLRGYDNIRKLPKSIGELKHLRYLDLSRTSLTHLPESVCGLYNLQTLNVSECNNLKHLPRYMYRFINLRCLRISDSCAAMPTQMRKLKNLQTLNIFIIGKHGETKICELQELSSLQGSLCIKNLRDVNVKDALEAKLIDKKHLGKLSLDWGDGGTDKTEHDKLVLENLVPSTTIQFLEVKHFRGTIFPNWVGDHMYCNMVKMELLNCKYCTSLPPFGQLSSLKSLAIERFPAIETLDHGFYGNSASLSMIRFPSLENLAFLVMSNWHTWNQVQTEDVRAFPKLKTLRISYCPKFIGNLPNSLPSLTELSIDGCRLITCSLPGIPSVQILNLVDCANLVSQELPSTVRSLRIGRCGNNFVSFSGTLLAMKYCLQDLEISDCPSLATLGTLPPPLKRLKIKNCEKLEFRFPYSHESLSRFIMSSSCDSIQCFPLNFFTNLTALSLTGLENLESLSLLDGASKDMASLYRLSIDSCPNLVSFPVSGLSAPKLTSLWIVNCEKLKRRPEQMQTLFPSLDNLAIDGCPELESFSGACLPPNLSRIKIGNCNKLVSSRTNWNLTMLTKLKEFEIEDSSEISCFPEEGLLPTSIISLRIGSFSILDTVNKNGLRQLTSLKQLSFCLCPKLRRIPVGGLPNSLEVLKIKECPLLDYNKLKKQIRKCSNEILIEITH